MGRYIELLMTLLSRLPLDPFGKDPHTTNDVMFILYEIVF